MRWRREVPADVRAVPGHRLGWARTQEGGVLVATDDALHLGDTVLAWYAIEKAVWRPPLLVVTEVSEVEGSGRTHTFSVTEDDHLAEVVRARVTSSVGWSDRRGLAPSGHVRLVGRRRPGEDALLWQMVFADAADAADDHKRRQAQQMVEQLRRSLG